MPLPAVASAPWVVLGVARSKRVRGLQAARSRLGLRPATVLEWGDWLALPAPRSQAFFAPHLRDGTVFKIEPPGDDAEAHHRLIELGCTRLGRPPRAPLAHGEFAASDAWFDGFTQAMHLVDGVLREVGGVRVVNGPHDILAMTDKWRCQQRLQAHGADIPALLGPVGSAEEFAALVDHHGLDRVFLKSRYGSSAAGVVAYRRNRRGQQQATTSAQLAPGTADRLFNVKRLRSYTRPSEIRHVFDLIAAQGAYAEAWVPKPRHGAGHFDVRVVTLAGRAAHRVARVGLRTLTNLHLDSERADPAALLDGETLQQMAAAADHAATAFTESRVIGFDLVVRPGSVRVLEANAFGDLLPGLQWRGHDTHEALLQPEVWS